MIQIGQRVDPEGERQEDRDPPPHAEDALEANGPGNLIGLEVGQQTAEQEDHQSVDRDRAIDAERRVPVETLHRQPAIRQRRHGRRSEPGGDPGDEAGGAVTTPDPERAAAGEPGHAPPEYPGEHSRPQHERVSHPWTRSMRAQFATMPATARTLVLSRTRLVMASTSPSTTEMSVPR